MESTIKHALMFTAMVLISILVLFGTCSAEAYIESPAEYYPLTAIVRDVIKEVTRIVIVEDATGNLWTFENENEFDINNIVSLMMYDNGTPHIFDGRIMMAVYGNYADGWL